ncbi:MAG: type II toxin-antitoxin system RelE/ParE family toxin [Anaerolineae bacterium]
MPQRHAEWSQLALNQFDELLNYLRERNPAVARRVGQVILAKIDQIEQFPEAQRSVPGLPATFREAFVENHRLLYRLVGDDRVRLLSLRHVQQRPLSPAEIIKLE